MSAFITKELTKDEYIIETLERLEQLENDAFHFSEYADQVRMAAEAMETEASQLQESIKLLFADDVERIKEKLKNMKQPRPSCLHFF